MFTIKLGYMDYEIHGMDEKTAKQYEADGLCRYNSQQILINPELHPQQQVSTFIHELLHAIFRAYMFPLTAKQEEDLCCRLETPITDVIKNNPTLMKKIMASLIAHEPFV